MSQAKREAGERRDKKSAAREERQNRRRRPQGETADWALADPHMLLYAIAAIAARGGALRLGYTRDGGAYAIGIYGDGDPYTEYVRPSEDLIGFLKGIGDDFSL